MLGSAFHPSKLSKITYDRAVTLTVTRERCLERLIAIFYEIVVEFIENLEEEVPCRHFEGTLTALFWQEERALQGGLGESKLVKLGEHPLTARG